MSNGIVQVNEETLDTFINQRNLPCGESVRSGHLSKAGCSEKDALLFLAVNRGDLIIIRLAVVKFPLFVPY